MGVGVWFKLTWVACGSAPVFTPQLLVSLQVVAALTSLTSGVHDVRMDVAKTSGSPRTDSRWRRLSLVLLTGGPVAVRGLLGTLRTTSDDQKHGHPEQYEN